MKILTALLTACTLYGAVATSAGAATDCAALVPPMHALHADLRAGAHMTEDQQTLWRTWDQDCRAPMWQAVLPPITAPPPPPVAPPVQAARPPVPGLTWRHVAIAFLQGMDRGLSRGTCTTRWWGSNTRGKYVTSCY